MFLNEKALIKNFDTVCIVDCSVFFVFVFVFLFCFFLTSL